MPGYPGERFLICPVLGLDGYLRCFQRNPWQPFERARESPDQALMVSYSSMADRGCTSSGYEAENFIDRLYRITVSLGQHPQK
jgi:hypothetical protein